jgi:DNA-directed RNA polymerase III subunit RPC6
MLYELTPHPTIGGDIWYFDNEFDAELVRVLNEQCVRLLDERLEESIEKYRQDPFLQRTHSLISSADLAAFINEMGILKVSLTIGQIESILDTLICDGKIQKVTVASTMVKENDTKSNLYRSIKPIINSSPIVRNPCGLCPVFNDCHDDGVINPTTCIYLNNWLDF